MSRIREIQNKAQEIKTMFSPELVTDVYSICRELEIDIIEESIKADAYLVCEGGKSYIVLKNTLDDKRKKFTLAHELGHFFIPWHSELLFGCDIAEMDFKNEYAPKEREANLFAAELLMPTKQFKEEFSGKIVYNNVSNLANIFEVSFQAALSRCIEFAKEDCMVICSSKKHIKWFKATEFFPLILSKRFVSVESGADELFDLNRFQVKVIQEPAYVWFGNTDDRTIEEESIMFPNYNEVISIIHLKDEL